jgi:tetratricopeptide (TPR) repeat protein
MLSPPANSPLAGRPVASASLALCYAVAGGTDVRVFRAFNLALHLLSALALLGLARRTFETPALRARFGAAGDVVAFAAALLWLVHPLATEWVVYVTQRTSSLMALFTLLTLYALVRSAGSARPRAWQVAAVAACALGMGSKEEMAVAPVLALLFDRACLSGSLAAALRARRALYAGLAASWGLLALLLATGPDYTRLQMGFGVGVHPLAYLVSQGPILAYYLRLALFPYPQILDYGLFQPVPLARALPSLLLLAALLAAALLAWRRAPRAGFLGLACFLALAPTSSVVPVGGEVGAERRMILPLAALALLASAGGFLALGRAAPRLRAPILAAAALALAAATAARIEVYRDPVELWRSVVRANPRNPRGHVELGNQLFQAERGAEALARYQEALRIAPGFSPAHNNLAMAYHAQGRIDLAIEHYQEALRLRADAPFVSFNLARALLARGLLAQAEQRLRAEIALSPDFAPAPRDLAWLLATQADPERRDPEQALALARRAEELTQGRDARVLAVLAASHAAGGRFGEAVAAGERGLAAAARSAAAGERDTRPALEAQLRLYRAERPFVQPATGGWVDPWVAP